MRTEKERPGTREEDPQCVVLEQQRKDILKASHGSGFVNLMVQVVFYFSFLIS